MTDEIAAMLRAMARLFETRGAVNRGMYENLTETDSQYGGHLLGKVAAYRDAANECREAANNLQEPQP